MSYDSLDKVPSNILEFCEPLRVYTLEDVRAAASEFIELDSSHWLAVVLPDEGISVSFSMYQFVGSDGNGTNVLVNRVFSGFGTGSGLREMRHIWWAPDELSPDCRGYTFYLPIDATVKALQHLKKYFD